MWALGRWTRVCLTLPSVTLLTSEAQCPHLKIGDNCVTPVSLGGLQYSF